MTNITFQPVHTFNFSIEHNTLHQKEHIFEIDPHIHDCCEVYVNLSGDISFMVENNIYPVKRGNAIITRPHEYHHCIYHSDAAHEFYWILFTSQGNEEILTPFFNRPFGERNLISYECSIGERLIHLCERFCKTRLSEPKKHECFWQLIGLLNQEQLSDVSSTSQTKSEISEALHFIDTHICEPIRITDLAKISHLSLNTLERYFSKELNMTPLEFIQKKRLNLAASFLRQGYCVQQAGMESGFSDISYFIKVFKRSYGMTPFQYKKQFA